MSGGGQDGQRARVLSREEDDAFRLARLAAAQAMPYFSHALFAMQPVALPGLDTFAVDRNWRLYMDPALLAGPGAWRPGVAAAVLQHEVGHLLRGHADRAESLPAPVNYLAWNLASDAEINDDLLAAGAGLPAGVVTPASLGFADQGLAEAYYEQLVSRDLRRLDGGPGCGSGAGGPGEPGEVPWTVSAGLPGLGPADADLVRRIVAREVATAAGRGRGTVPAGLDRWAGEVLAPPAIPWQQVLRGAVRGVIASEAGRTDYSYKRLSRRQVPGVIRPGMRSPSLTAAVVVDTSGSMGAAQLSAALGEIGGLLSSAGVRRDQVRVLACDAAAAAPQRVRAVSDIRLTGGGGTDMRVGIDAAARLRPEPNVIIVLTDGITPWPEQPPRPRLVCAVISPVPPRGTPEWAVTVHIPDGPGRTHTMAPARRPPPSPVPEPA